MTTRLKMLMPALSVMAWLAVAPLIAEPLTDDRVQSAPYGDDVTSRSRIEPTAAQAPTADTSQQGLPLLPPPALRETSGQGAQSARAVIAEEELPSASAFVLPRAFEPAGSMTCACHIHDGQCSVCRPAGDASRGAARHKPWWRPLHWGEPERFIPTPLGTSLRSHFGAQVVNGWASQLVLYDYDFCDPDSADAAALTAAGRVRLTKLTDLLVQSPWPLIIQPSHDPHLDAARQLHVATALEHLTHGFILPDRVVVDVPAARGVSGVEAMLHHRNMLQQTMAAGVYVSPTETAVAPAAATPVVPVTPAAR